MQQLRHAALQAAAAWILYFSPGDPLSLDKNSSTAWVVGVRAQLHAEHNSRAWGKIS